MGAYLLPLREKKNTNLRDGITEALEAPRPYAGGSSSTNLDILRSHRGFTCGIFEPPNGGVLEEVSFFRTAKQEAKTNSNPPTTPTSPFLMHSSKALGLASIIPCIS